MALVPFRVSGPAADQTVEQRIFQIGQYTVYIDQDVHKSGSLQGVGHQHSSISEVKSGASAAAVLLLQIYEHAEHLLTGNLLQVRKQKSIWAMLVL